MIKSKIDARERALELAIKGFNSAHSFSAEQVVEFSQVYEQYLICDAELPETQSDTELVKAFLEVMNNEFEKKCKPQPDYEELMKAIQTGKSGIVGEMPSKSTNE